MREPPVRLLLWKKKSISPTDFADLRADGCEVADRTFEGAGLKDLVDFSVHVSASMPSDAERSDVFIEAGTFFFISP